jgi:hypothetical protein
MREDVRSDRSGQTRFGSVSPRITAIVGPELQLNRFDQTLVSGLLPMPTVRIPEVSAESYRKGDTQPETGAQIVVTIRQPT